ncbi:undecaprenyl/decaprenyl-phosphate alpha-N-acetylglucosaminyl 1-phosphate transferase [Patescibacteria group bacterium]|nr:undecaprenyl/decaprenyl-phosphate alpha-N-acetylglucosaminyl 1-phosphate transferase [Patescibacteria group bacterium]MBU4374915.1 undecaprenyl/decaprenyl-phosphate alpha-N-acetylglucosaminyl 1-phosphate transferase [Patescibacteria group bacterium]MBU4601101.1 undecaprenyl/decaprenyl-phosphate alpha-N-acetylglucosaminyl 1-phosphate transferase [Patescibacteria group bacterium]
MKFFAVRLNIIDKPEIERKIHKINTPLFGGAAIFLAFFIILYFARAKLLAGDLESHHWLGFFVGACFLMIGGFLDDKYNLSPKVQIIFPLFAIFSVIAGGVGIDKITNPLGGLISLGQLQIPIMAWGGAIRYFTVIADTFTVLWLMGMMYTTKLLDGVDGLVSGVAGIGGFVIFLFTMTTKYYQPDIGLAALILAGACFGFLIFNWHPAKIFLGEGGSLLLGYILGVLAIISGGKIAIALLIMGIPIMDVVWTIIRRIIAGQNPFKFSDKKHLHFRFLDIGLSQRQTVVIYYGFSFIFGISALFLQSKGKVFVLAGLIIIMLFIAGFFTYLDRKRKII